MPEQSLAYMRVKLWRQANPERYREYMKIYMSNRRKLKKEKHEEALRST